MRIALFTGSFDPFTVGHESIVRRALKISDKVVIGVGNNEKKGSFLSIENRVAGIEQLYKGDPRVKTVAYEGLTVEVAQRENASFILRGVRSVFDYEYERNMAEVNRKLTGIETILLFTDPEYAHVSSSVVRELMKLGKDVSDYLPKRK